MVHTERNPFAQIDTSLAHISLTVFEFLWFVYLVCAVPPLWQNGDCVLRPFICQSGLCVVLCLLENTFTIPHVCIIYIYLFRIYIYLSVVEAANQSRHALLSSLRVDCNLLQFLARPDDDDAWPATQPNGANGFLLVTGIARCVALPSLCRCRVPSLSLSGQIDTKRYVVLVLVLCCC